MVYVIEPFPEGKPFPLASTANKEMVGDMMLQSQMVGMINVLAGLADYTNQVFSSLLKESAGTFFLSFLSFLLPKQDIGISSRIAAIGERCAILTHKVEETENIMSISFSPSHNPSPSAL
jgi:hypothetical protein